MNPLLYSSECCVSRVMVLLIHPFIVTLCTLLPLLLPLTVRWDMAVAGAQPQQGVATVARSLAARNRMEQKQRQEEAERQRQIQDRTDGSAIARDRWAMAAAAGGRAGRQSMASLARLERAACSDGLRYKAF